MENFQLPSPKLAMTDRTQHTTDIWRIRPNNYSLLAPIVKDDPNSHLPTCRKTGWHGSTPREYDRMNGVTVERTSRNVIFHLKRKFIRFISKSEDIDRVEQEVKDFLLDAAFRFQQNYPTIVLDLFRARFITKEIEVKDPKLRLPKDMLMQDTICKKVYRKADSFELKTLRSPELLKQYVKNRAIEDWNPELAKKMDFIVEQQTKFAHNLDLHLQVLQDMRNYMRPKQNILSKIGSFIKRIFS